MSRKVSKFGKALRVVGISFYLAVVFAGMMFYFFEDFNMAVIGFFSSLVYFSLILSFLIATNNIHFPILVDKDQIKDVKFESTYKLIWFESIRIFFSFMVIIMILLIAYFVYIRLPNPTVGLLILLVFLLYYFPNHRIRYYVAKEGVIFNYGGFIVLLRWQEITSVVIKGNHVELLLRNKKVKRKLIVREIKEFEAAVKKFKKVIIVK
jgi:hypothetical protein